MANGTDPAPSDDGQAGNIESMLAETRRFEPPENFVANAHVDADRFAELTRLADDDPAGFWGTQALEHLTWSKPFDRVMEGTMPETTWFLGGELNASVQCLDRHLDSWR
ncbi:MAG: acetyl-coenzyme A synthetase N-terminal domain-containing protein, partial [Planctomycetota bacterium]